MSFGRFIFNTFARTLFTTRHVPIKQVLQTVPKRNLSMPCMLGFSVFTWLGFDTKKSSPEDELITTIKHCILFIQRGEHVKAEQLLHVGLRQAQQMNNQLAITYIYDIMANLALERDQLDKAKNLFIAVTQRVMANGAKEDDPRVVHISAKLARISHLKKEYETAQLGYDWCLDKLNSIIVKDPSIDNLKVLALTEDWYGRLYLDSKQYEAALKLMISALSRMRLVNDVEREHIVYQLNDIGTIYNQVGKTDESINYFKEAIELGNELKMEDLGTMYVNLGIIYLKQNLLEEARKHCGHAFRLGVLAKNDDVKKEAQYCIKQINSL